jgi:hypothetical protein
MDNFREKVLRFSPRRMSLSATGMNAEGHNAETTGSMTPRKSQARPLSVIIKVHCPSGEVAEWLKAAVC